MRWILKSFDPGFWSAGRTAKSITAAVTATAMTLAITIHRAPLFGAPLLAPPDQRPASILTPLLISLFFGLTLNTFALNAYLQNPPNDPNALYVDVIGFQWGWRFVYPNARELIGEFRVPEINRTCTPGVRGCWSGTVILNITSADVFHSFGIPDFKIKRDAIPGRVNQAWFVAEQSGIFPEAIRCYELCGTGHALMMADLIIQSPDSFHDWYLSGV